MDRPERHDYKEGTVLSELELEVADESDTLQGLAEPHLVPQNHGHATLEHAYHPRDALHLRMSVRDE